ncbi:Kazaltype serine protease inhibitor domain containing protein [Acanthamoeba castellanii str. Neff]|uniref:Kazaltype serine protease inhibitor domain containing protein n=1 Tax=Acanthamoeba castellanii (strain ATCC 30010 / Neff) TaxID=1257118 RepID=L8GCX3_ACACF|nr:Kazaltype serine protease inhibitor domain containing protein [Acanthamoeba castellanii str. Neff]ELR10922.1 Kazaltype serine protease inhibitor domain containing protein [Acanthamoeba castellanii str. Neff]
MVVVVGCCLLAPGGCAGQVTTTTPPATTTTRPSPPASPLPGTCGAVCSLDQPCQQSAGLFCAFPNLLCGGKGVCERVPQACTLEFRPVCGCDFMTYANPCSAAAAGQATFAFKACNDTLKCSADSDCAAGFHCRFPAERCGGVGLCSRIPDMCTLELNSVCGCNDQTYSNPCLAFSSGVSIRSFGECQVENAFACRNNSQCSADQYCRYEPGITYDNPCIASSAGVSIDSLGACEECAFGQFCRFDPSTCGGIGSCINAPDVCTAEMSPVCGCDNTTYDNLCFAQASGASILDPTSPCQAAVSCTNSSDCAAVGEYCHFLPGECGGVGQCASIPQACTRLLNPVCGCDNVTYDNLCLASAAGASLQALGSCGPDPGVGAGSCDRDSDCAAANQYCQFRDGECGGPGVCVDTPQFCTLELRPVCGCDGETYGNQCAAQAQGVSIRSATSGCPSPSPLPAS